MIFVAIIFGIIIAYCSWSFTPEMVVCSSFIFLAYFFLVPIRLETAKELPKINLKKLS
jgi:hypothetical protein